MNYTVKVNNNLELIISPKELSNLDVIKTSVLNYHILKNNKSYKAEIINSNFNDKTFTVNINNNNYDIKISSPLDILIKDMGFTFGSTKHINSIKAPMPGLILDINVNVGQDVKENDALLILEAMKMENIITSPKNGVIKSITVNKGDAIEKGQLLIEFE